MNKNRIVLKVAFVLGLMIAGGAVAETTIEDLQQLQSSPSTLEQLLNPYAYAQTCFKSGEKTDQMSKICYYKCTCGKKALNIKATELCPLNKKFNC